MALTFDDGPDPAYTGNVLELLSRQSAHATFFVIGQHAEEYPDLTNAIVASGHELANHTWSHRRLASIPADEAIEEIDRGQESVSHFTQGVLIRAPYGEVKAETLLAIQSDGLIPVHWSVPLDHYVEELGGAPLDAARAIARDTMPGDIILAHDAHDGGIDRDHTIDAVRYLLPFLRTRGYSVVAVSTLLSAGTPVWAQARPWFWQSGFECSDP